MGRHSTERQTCSKYWPPKYDDPEFLAPRILPKRSMFKIRIAKTEATFPQPTDFIARCYRAYTLLFDMIKPFQFKQMRIAGAFRAQLIVYWSYNTAKVFLWGLSLLLDGK